MAVAAAFGATASRARAEPASPPERQSNLRGTRGKGRKPKPPPPSTVLPEPPCDTTPLRGTAAAGEMARWKQGLKARAWKSHGPSRRTIEREILALTAAFARGKRGTVNPACSHAPPPPGEEQHTRQHEIEAATVAGQGAVKEWLRVTGMAFEVEEVEEVEGVEEVEEKEDGRNVGPPRCKPPRARAGWAAGVRGAAPDGGGGGGGGAAVCKCRSNCVDDVAARYRERPYGGMRSRWHLGH